MAEIPPWLNPPDYLGAMRSGAGLGLSLRQQDAAEQDAADRLRLSYAHLASQEEEKKAQMAAAQEYRNAGLALRRQQMEAMDRYRNQPKVHFGPNGEILQEQGGGINVLRKRDPIPPHIMSGPGGAINAVDPNTLAVQNLLQGKEPADSAERALVAEHLRKKAVFDRLDRESRAMEHSTKPVTHWFGRPDTQAPLYDEDTLIKAKAKADEAQKDMEDAASALIGYRSTGGPEPVGESSTRTEGDEGSGDSERSAPIRPSATSAAAPLISFKRGKSGFEAVKPQGRTVPAPVVTAVPAATAPIMGPTTAMDLTSPIFSQTQSGLPEGFGATPQVAVAPEVAPTPIVAPVAAPVEAPVRSTTPLPPNPPAPVRPTVPEQTEIVRAISLYRQGRMSKSKVNQLVGRYNRSSGSNALGITTTMGEVRGPEWVTPKPQARGKVWVPSTVDAMGRESGGRWVDKTEEPGPYE